MISKKRFRIFDVVRYSFLDVLIIVAIAIPVNAVCIKNTRAIQRLQRSRSRYSTLKWCYINSRDLFMGDPICSI